jgi:integrase
MAIKVTLRKKPISRNRESCYLDLYPPISDSKTGGLTRREFLNLFLISETEHEEQSYVDKRGKLQKRIVPLLNKSGQPKQRKLSAFDKQHNKNTWDLAEQIKLRRENEINKPLIYSDLEKERLKATECEKGNFVEYFKELADEKSIKEKGNWNVVYKNLSNYTNGILQFKDLTEGFCMDFRNYLLKLKAYNNEEKVISQNSACTYFVKFKAGVKQAWKDKKIASNIGSNVSTIKLLETQRDFLSTDDLNKLLKTECYDPMLKKAFLFSALSGLRKGDILKLTWGELELINKRHKIRFRQQKTKKIETVCITDQAFSLLGEPGKAEEKVFPGLKINSYYSKYLLLWVAQAGINKKISFHCARHSMATNQLSSGTLLSTVSGMLGHKSVKTTQIYAKVIDALKEEAADRVKLDM